MFYRCYEEEGDYIDNATGEDRNMQSCYITVTPEGINVGWTEFESESAAMEFFNISKKVRE